jgi:histidine triad (HIT) family protein
METIFTKIITREIPADIIYEDDTVLAFLDIQPINPGHTLVIPKVPSIDGTVVNPNTLAHMMEVAQKIANALKESVACTGVNFIMNNGADAGQEVFHTHLHVVPRHKDDKAFEPPHRREYNAFEAQDIIETMQKHLS